MQIYLGSTAVYLMLYMLLKFIELVFYVIYLYKPFEYISKQLF